MIFVVNPVTRFLVLELLSWEIRVKNAERFEG